MKTNLTRRIVAMFAIVMLLSSMFAIGASATAVKDCTNQDWCDELQAQIDGDVDYATSSKSGYVSYTVNYKDSNGNAKTQTVYLSELKYAKTNTDDVDVSIDEDGKLQIEGINDNDTGVWNQLFSKFKGIIVGITGIGTLVMIVLFIIQFMKLGASAGNPQARQQALMGVLWTGVATALLGSVTIIIGFFYNAI